MAGASAAMTTRAMMIASPIMARRFSEKASQFK
jgi:hypothetical protein